MRNRQRALAPISDADRPRHEADLARTRQHLQQETLNV